MRITDAGKHTSLLSIWICLGAVLALAGGVYYYFSLQTVTKATAGPGGYLRPVPSNAKLRSELTDVQYHVTRENGTETAFRNQYWDNVRPGIYVDVITRDPLFCSLDKFDSGLGRPSFTKPLRPDAVTERPDNSFNMQRTEVRAAKSDSHLGHVFNDGPQPGGRRYAINSAALSFIPVDKMQGEGYAELLPLFNGGAASPAPSAAANASPAAK